MEWGWTWRKLLALHDTCQAVRDVLRDPVRPAVATDLLDALGASACQGAAVAIDSGHAYVQADDLTVVIGLPRWATVLLEPLEREVTL